MTEFIKEHEKEFRENYADINTKQIISSINYLLESTIPIEKVKKLEKENVTLKNFTYSIFNDNIEKEFIPKQKIKEKIEELKNEKEQLRIDKNVTWDSQIYKIDLKIQVLQELLQEEDK